jgi:hypothetical protein
MKIQIKKIIIGAAVLLFAMTSVSFAHDDGRRHHKRHAKMHKYHKTKKDHYRWHKRHYKVWKHHRDRYSCDDIHHHRYQKKHSRHWKKHQAKQGWPYRDRYRYRDAHHDHHNRHRHNAPSEDLIYKLALKDPGLVFKVILKVR